jgi:hypothetical protein
MMYIFILNEGVSDLKEVNGTDKEADTRSGPNFSSVINLNLKTDVSVFQTV